MKLIHLFSIVAAGMLSAGAVMAQNPEQNAACCPMMGTHKKEMVEWHQKMVEKFKAQNAELDKLVADMNAAPAEKKVDAMAAVVSKMAADRKAWATDVEEGHQKMMEWMKNMKENVKEKMEMKEKKESKH